MVQIFVPNRLAFRLPTVTATTRFVLCDCRNYLLPYLQPHLSHLPFRLDESQRHPRVALRVSHRARAAKPEQLWSLMRLTNSLGLATERCGLSLPLQPFLFRLVRTVTVRRRCASPSRYTRCGVLLPRAYFLTAADVSRPQGRR